MNAVSVAVEGPSSFPVVQRGRQLSLYAALATLPLALSLARLVTGPWYHTHNPLGVGMLEGWPTAWETTYYLAHFPTFLSDAPPQQGIASIQYRTLPQLYLATALYAWTGSALLSMMTVDWLFWFLGAVAVYHVAQRLGAEPWAAALAALMLVAAPLFAFSIWRVDLRLGNSATMSLGLWAALVLIDEHKQRLRLAFGLGFLLLFLSVSYNYQWLLLPLLVVIARTSSSSLNWRQTVVVLAAAVGVYVATTGLLKLVLATAIPAPVDHYSGVAAQAGDLAALRAVGVGSAADVLKLLPGPYHLRMMVEAYHPLVFATGVSGMLLLPSRARWLGLVATVVTLLASGVYPQPWLAMSAYPILYAGAGVLCAAAGSLVARGLANVVRFGGRSGRWSAGVRPGVSLALASILAALTNLDLVGNPRFLLQWWRYYERIIF